MNTIDIILSIFLLLGAVRGFFKGFLLELSGLVALLAGIYGAIHFSDGTYRFLQIFITWEEKYLSLLSFAFTFGIIVVIVSIIGKLLTKMAGILALGLVNRLLGAVFGMLKTAFLASLFFMFLNQTGAFLIDEDTKTEAVLYPPVEKLAPMLLPTIIEEIREGDFFETPAEEKEI